MRHKKKTKKITVDSLLHKTQAGFLLGLSRSQHPKNRVLMKNR